jgi:selenide,water dikinase
VDLSAELDFKKIPTILPDLVSYIEQKAVPGGTYRNWDSYGSKVGAITEIQKAILADPQTSGGLLIAIGRDSIEEVKSVLQSVGLEKFIEPIGFLRKADEKMAYVI